jgi:hypothetical protein
VVSIGRSDAKANMTRPLERRPIGQVSSQFDLAKAERIAEKLDTAKGQVT